MKQSTKYYYEVWDKSRASSTVLDAVFDRLDAEDLYYVEGEDEFYEHIEVFRERCNMWIRQLIQIRDALDSLQWEERKENGK